MKNLTLELSEEERVELVRILTHELGEARVEVHRTHTPAFRDTVIAEENLLRNLLAKVSTKEPVAKV